jgi:ribosomal protein S27AE
MDIRVEQPCPQCGGGVTLSASDRVLACPFCRVKNYLITGGPFRYTLPNRAREQGRVYHAPYLRFKGNIFSVTASGVSHRVVDTTQDGCGLPGLPASLGVRPQAMNLLRVHSGSKGSFLPFSRAVRDIFEKATKLHNMIEGRSDEPLYHHAYIGETLSFIYLPLLLRQDGLFDAVLGEPLTAAGKQLNGAVPFQPHWQIKFKAALCPRCGGNLDGEGDCLVLTCPACDTAWQIGKEGLERAGCMTVPGGAATDLYLPFWKIAARMPALQLRTFADFAERTNQPLVARAAWKNQAMQFYVPAFKLRPDMFLRTGRQITISQHQLGPERAMRASVQLNPVTLPLSEAKQSLKVILAACAVNGPSLFPLLPQTQPEITASSLIFLPFADKHHEWMQSHTGIVIAKSVLLFGRKL